MTIETEEKRKKIESITAVPAENVPEEVRAKEGMSSDKGFVEVIVERKNSATTRLNFMGKETPGGKFARLLKEAKIKF